MGKHLALLVVGLGGVLLGCGRRRTPAPAPPPPTIQASLSEELPLTHLYAYSFQSPLSMPEILKKLKRLGPWRWIERDNDNWGEYVSARALEEPHDHGMVKLISDEGRYIINVYLRSRQPGAQPEFEAVREIIFKRVLPAIKASDIQKTDDIES